MDSTFHRWAAVLLILMTGCSSSGLFGARSAKGRSAVSDVFDSAGAADETPAPPTDSDARRKVGQTAITGSSLDPVQRRRKVTEQLAVAARADQAGDIRAARSAYERVLQLEPGHSLANYQLAVIADNDARFDDAERHYRVLLGKTPQNPDLLASLGWSYLLQGRYDESERTLRDALSIDPQHRTALYNLGWLYGTLGDYDHAQEVFRSAGSEADAKLAMAELFPRGRPEADPRSPASAPRNPFRPAARDVSAASLRTGQRTQDRLVGDAVSAPAPWQNQGEPTVSSDILHPSTRSAVDRPSDSRDERKFDEVFSALEASPDFRSSRAPPSPDESDASLSLPPDVPGHGAAPPDTIRTAGFDHPSAILPNDAPLITPKLASTPRAASGRTAIDRSSSDRGPVDPRAAAARLPVELPQKVAAQDRNLPDWPYRAAISQNASVEPVADSSPHASPRITAALLGLSAGPDGLLFPAILPPTIPGAIR